MRLILNSILVLVVLFASYVEYAYFIVVPPKLGEVVPFSVRSQGSFTFDQDKALRGRRDIALSRYVPLYTYLPGIAEKVKTRMDDLIKEVGNISANPAAEIVDRCRVEVVVEGRIIVVE